MKPTTRHNSPHLSSPPPIVLSIAGSDSGGGAGIQADLHSLAAFGVHAVTALTAVTAQNSRGVCAIQMMSKAIVLSQIQAVLADFPVAAIKIGMLGTPTLALAIARILAKHPEIPVVLDPVLVATSGASLARGKLVHAMARHLLPRADLLTPNIPEAEALLNRRLRTRRQMREGAQSLRAMGARAVLLKAGHLSGPTVDDLLLSAKGEFWFSHSRIAVEGHGTGCSLSAAIAAGLARKLSLEDAVAGASDFVHRALRHAYRPGKSSLAFLNHQKAGAE